MAKRCTACLQMLDACMFTKRMASPDHLSFTCRACNSAKAKERYKANPESSKRRAEEWAQRNPEARKLIAQQWDHRNAERKREQNKLRARAARKANLDAARLAGRIAAQKRRHRVAEAESAPSSAVVARLLKIASGRCTYCLGVFNRLTIDHFQPVSKGGNGQWWNIVPCCGSCNSSKKDSDGPIWVERKFGVQRLAEVIWKLESLSAARLP